jgi:hypothetical protein
MVSLMTMAAGQAASTGWDLFTYNRKNFMFDGEMILKREYQGQSMRIKRFNLYREDIRDVVSITTDRMDVFLVVATLLLTFSIGWLSDNSVIADDELPRWFKSFFVITNFASIGYLLLCVWLAVHASMAAHSMGGRLLLNYSRLSIPTRKQLEQIKVPLFPVVEALVGMGKKLGVLNEDGKLARPVGALRSLRRGAQAQDNGVAAERHCQGGTASAAVSATTPLVQTNTTSFPADGDPEDPAASELREASMLALADGRSGEEMHFKRLLHCQAKWLSFDCYARICMCLGMNQLLSALSYYVVGTLFRISTTAAFFAFVGIKFLGSILMQLDITTTHTGSSTLVDNSKKYVTAAMLLFQLLPQLIAAIILYYVDLPAAVDNLAVIPCFLLHMMWLLYMTHQIAPTQHKHSHGAGGVDVWLPRQFRQVGYLNVIDMQQRKLAEHVANKGLKENIDNLRAACEELEEAMQHVMDEERDSGSVSSHGRNTATLCTLGETLHERISELCKPRQKLSNDGQAASEVTAAEKVIERFAMWKRAPEILAMFDALQGKAFASLRTEEEQEMVQMAYADFKNKCLELDLGIVIGSAKDKDDLDTLRAATPDQPALRVNVEHDTGAMDAWVDPRTQRLVARQPSSLPVTSLSRVIHEELPQWSGRETELSAHARIAPSTRDAPSLSPVSNPPDGVDNLTPEDATPPNALPGRLVQLFTLACAFLWLGGMCIHIVVSHHESPTIATLQTFSAVWPKPSNFFQIANMSCNRTQVVLRSGSSWRAAQRFDNDTIGKQVKIMKSRSDDLHVFCDRMGCDMLSSVPGGDSWVVAPLKAPWGSGRANTSLPAQEGWLRTVFAWGNCEDGATPKCDKAWLAGWDGYQIIVVELQAANGTNVFTDIDQFAFDYSYRRCDASAFRIWGNCGGTPTKPDDYTDIRGLVLRPDSSSLYVLLPDGWYDAWDLAAGNFQSRQYLEKHNYTDVCTDGEKVLFSRPATYGPKIQSTDAYQPGEGAGCDRTARHRAFLGHSVYA